MQLKGGNVLTLLCVCLLASHCTSFISHLAKYGRHIWQQQHKVQLYNHVVGDLCCHESYQVHLCSVSSTYTTATCVQFAVKPYNMLSVSTSESKIVKSASNWVSYTFLWLTTYQYLHHVMYWNPLKKTVKNKCEKPFTLIVWPQICSPQTNRKPWRVWKHGKTGVPVTASPRISTLSGTWTRSRGPLPHCPLCFSLYISPEKCNSLDAVPPVSFTTGQESWYNEST